MCFTPVISISTAIIEFILAIILILYFPRSKLRNFFAFFIVMLGTYQFSEYLVCTGSNPEFWATVGIINYSFLPAAGFHAVLRTFHKKFSLFFIYIILVIASIALVVIPNFVIKAECSTYFINVSTLTNTSESLFYSLLHLYCLLCRIYYYVLFNNL